VRRLEVPAVRRPGRPKKTWDEVVRQDHNHNLSYKVNMQVKKKIQDKQLSP
jgi:hypothetical protein